MVAVVAAGTLLIAEPPAEASGTYPPVSPARPPSRPGDRSTLDRRTYEEGQRVFSGRVPLLEPSADREAEQRQVLTRWQSRLPFLTKLRVNLPAMSGRLTEDQMATLAYFLAIRYKIDTR